SCQEPPRQSRCPARAWLPRACLARARHLGYPVGYAPRPSRTPRASAPPVTRMPAIANRPAAKLCVASLIAPSRYGPTKPPVFPPELISAIDAAAPTPATSDVASAQNGPNIDARLATATVSVATVQTTPDDSVLADSAAAHNAAGTAKCQRRSPLRSDRRPTSTIATAPAAYGIALSSPT